MLRRLPVLSLVPLAAFLIAAGPANDPRDPTLPIPHRPIKEADAHLVAEAEAKVHRDVVKLTLVQLAAAQAEHAKAAAKVVSDRTRVHTNTSASGPAPSGSDAAFLACTRAHESNTAGGYGAVNPTGKYMGAYQFDQSTWNSVASRTDPSLVGVAPNQASPAQQDAARDAALPRAGQSALGRTLLSGARARGPG